MNYRQEEMEMDDEEGGWYALTTEYADFDRPDMEEGFYEVFMAILQQMGFVRAKIYQSKHVTVKKNGVETTYYQKQI